MELSSDRRRLRERRLQQRSKVAASPLLDHEGLARSLTTSFRQWWRQWLNQQGWILDGANGAAWVRAADASESPVAVANSPALRVPLWLGPLNSNEREDWQRKGREVIRLDTLRPWGMPVALFHEQRRDKVLGWLEQGINSTEKKWWQQVYPQLLWEEEAHWHCIDETALVHQNFPGQFRDLGPALCDRGHELKAIGSSHRTCDSRIEVMRYEHQLGERSGVHHHSLEVDEWILRSEQVAEQAMTLKQRGWVPDVMLAHPGWGEALLLRQVFPSTPLVIWPELWLRPEHSGHAQRLSERAANAVPAHQGLVVDGAMADASLAIVPNDIRPAPSRNVGRKKLPWCMKVCRKHC